MNYGRHNLMVIAAHRYCLGRITYIVGDCVDWLLSIWPELPEETKSIIQRDTEEAFKRDDEDRADGHWSDCSTHNEPAYPNGECDCGGYPAEQEPVARVSGYYSGRCVIEPLNRATVLPTDMALYTAPQPDMNLSCKSVQKRLATLWGYVKTEPVATEQEPVVFYRCNGCGHAYESFAPSSCDCMEGQDFSRIEYYAAPVRTKDLSDDEISKAVGSPLDEVYLADFRAVIAADREKNK